MAKSRRSWGSIRELPARPNSKGKKYQASFTGPDTKRHFAPVMFQDKPSAKLWLKREEKRIKKAYKKGEEDQWVPPRERAAERMRKQQAEEVANESQPILKDYIEQFLAHREVKGRPLSPVTRDNYRTMARLYINPVLGEEKLSAITKDMVRDWYDQLPQDRPTTRARAYQTLRTVMNDAIEHDLIEGPNPCRLKGAGQVQRATTTTIATDEEIEAATAAMPEYRSLMVPLAAYCGLRLGEVLALQRGDFDIEQRIIKVRHSVAVTRDGSGTIRKSPKTDAGNRDVPIPRQLLPRVQEHLAKFTGPRGSSLLFPAEHGGLLTSGSFRDHWHIAREAAGRPDLRYHDLRHTALTKAAQKGATAAELMALGGHSDLASVARYQWATVDRMRALADRLMEDN